MRRDGLGSRKTWACERKSIRGRIRHDGGEVRFWVSRQGRLVAQICAVPLEPESSGSGPSLGRNSRVLVRTCHQHLNEVAFWHLFDQKLRH